MIRKDPRQHVYRIVDVWGFEDYASGAPVKVGNTLLDKWKGRGEQTWTIYNLDTMTPIGGWTGFYLGRKEDHWPSEVNGSEAVPAGASSATQDQGGPA